MRNTILILLINIPLLALSQDKCSKDYFKAVTTLDQLKTSSKKPILLFTTTKTCGACVKMEKTTFANDSIYLYLISNFDTYKVYLDSIVDNELKSLLNVNCYPSFIIMDSNFQMEHKFTGYMNTHDFMRNCSLYNTQYSLSSALSKYNDGNRDKNFLYDLCINLKGANELDSFYVNEYLNSLSYEELSLNKTMNFITFNAIIKFKSTINSGSTPFRSMIENKEKYYVIFGKENFEQLIVWLIYNEVLAEISNGNYKKFENAINQLKEYDNKYEICFLRNEQNEILGIINGKNMTDFLFYLYFEKNGSLKQRKVSLRNYLKIISKDSDQLNNFAQGIYYEFNEIEKLKLAEKCVKKSIKIKRLSSNEKTYAYILSKFGKRSKALRHIKKAIELGADKDEMSELINQINQQ